MHFLIQNSKQFFQTNFFQKSYNSNQIQWILQNKCNQLILQLKEIQANTISQSKSTKTV